MQQLTRRHAGFAMITWPIRSLNAAEIYFHLRPNRVGRVVCGRLTRLLIASCAPAFVAIGTADSRADFVLRTERENYSYTLFLPDEQTGTFVKSPVFNHLFDVSDTLSNASGTVRADYGLSTFGATSISITGSERAQATAAIRTLASRLMGFTSGGLVSVGVRVFGELHISGFLDSTDWGHFDQQLGIAYNGLGLSGNFLWRLSKTVDGGGAFNFTLPVVHDVMSRQFFGGTFQISVVRTGSASIDRDSPGTSSLSLVNDTATNGSFVDIDFSGLTVLVNDEPLVGAVPEPAGWVMLLGALGTWPVVRWRIHALQAKIPPGKRQRLDEVTLVALCSHATTDGVAELTEGSRAEE